MNIWNRLIRGQKAGLRVLARRKRDGEDVLCSDLCDDISEAVPLKILGEVVHHFCRGKVDMIYSIVFTSRPVT